MSIDIVASRFRACEASLKRVLELKPSVLGIGTGSTIDVFIDVLSSYRDAFKETRLVCASLYTCSKLAEKGFTVIHPSVVQLIDVYVDGADEVNPELNMIKGGGAASTLEKILAYGSRYRIYVVDYIKLVKSLGEEALATCRGFARGSKHCID
jgi:ribose 5-phosphate isomerase A